MTSQLYFGQVMHQRMMPMHYRFNYRVFGLMIDIDTIEQQAKSLRWLSINQFNLLSVYYKDSGARNEKPWRLWVQELLNKAHIHDIGRIRLLCFPRVLGYTFNPLSLWFCENSAGQLIAIISEVSNTFGQHYHYVHHNSGQELIWPIHCDVDKRFHVSPFIDMNQRYHFTFDQSAQTLRILINEYQDQQLHFVASQTAELTTLNNRTLLRAFFMVPLMSFKIMTMIHWHALKIWLKGGQFHHATQQKNTEVNSLWQVKNKG